MKRKQQHRRKNALPAAATPALDALSKRRTLALCVGLIVLVVVVHARVATFPFINYDDQIYVTENPDVLSGLSPRGIGWAFQATRASNWHPLTWISHMADATVFRDPTARFGQWAGGHHLVNVAIHGANSVLLFLLLSRMTSAPWRSAVVAALFAVHPLHVESVVWVAERKDVLSTLFWLLTTFAYLKSLEAPSSTARRLLVPLCLALGLMVKPMLVTLPFTLLLLDYWPLGRFRRVENGRKPSAPLTVVRPLVREKIPLFALVTASCVVTFFVQRSGGAMALGTQIALPVRFANAVVASATYLAKTLWPVDLAVFYPHPLGFPPLGLFLPALLTIAVCTTIAMLSIRRFPYLFVGWFWYLGTLVPVLGIVQVGMQAMADRYTYVPLIGIFVTVTWAAAALMERWKIATALRMAVVLGLLVALTALAVRQVGFWSSSETLFTHALAVTGSDANYVAHQQLAVTLLDNGRPREALMHFTLAMKLAPQAREPREGAAGALLALGHAREAAMQYRGLLEIHPNDVAVANNLAWLLATSADPQLRNGTEAVVLAENAVQSPGGHTSQFLDTLAAAYAEAGRFDAAVDAASEAQRIAESVFDYAQVRDIGRRIAIYRARRPFHE